MREETHFALTPVQVYCHTGYQKLTENGQHDNLHPLSLYAFCVFRFVELFKNIIIPATFPFKKIAIMYWLQQVEPILCAHVQNMRYFDTQLNHPLQDGLLSPSISENKGFIMFCHVRTMYSVQKLCVKIWLEGAFVSFQLSKVFGSISHCFKQIYVMGKKRVQTIAK